MNGHVLYLFEEYRVDPARRELWRGDDQLSVQPKAFDCLAYLIQHRDRVVGNDELIAAVWGRTDLSDNVVMHSIARARHAVGDNGELQRAIRTVTRVGYAWNLPVTLISANPSATDTPSGLICTHVGVSGNDDEKMGSPSANRAADERVDAENDHTSLTNGCCGPLPAFDREKARVALGAKRSHRLIWFIAAVASVLVLVLSAIGLFSVGRSNPDPIADEAAVVLPVTVAGGTNSGTAWIRLGIMDFIAERFRDLGQAVIPSDNTVALVRTYLKTDEGGTYRVEDIEALAGAVSAGLVLGVQAEEIGSGHWQVSMRTVHGRNPAVIAQADAADLLAASRAATDRMAVMLGLDLASQRLDVPGTENEIDYALRRVRAALLSDHFDQADAILTNLDGMQRRDFRVRFELAELDAQRGENDKALAGLHSLLADLHEDDSALLKAKIMRRIGVIHSRQNNYPEALAIYQQALTTLQGRQNYEERVLVGRVLMSMAVLLALEERLDESEITYAKARIAIESSGDQYLLAKLDVGLSTLYTRMGRSEAVAYARRGAERLKQFGDAQNELRARVNLVIAYYNEQDIVAASAELHHFDELLAKTNNDTLSVDVRIYELAVLVDSGQLTAASGLLKRLREWQVNESDFARIDYFDANRLFAMRDFQNASSLAKAAVRPSWEPGLYGEKASAWLVLHRAQVELGQVELASETLQQAIAWGASVGDRRDVKLPLILMRAEHAAAAGNDAAAASHFEEALTLADQWGQPDALVQIVKSYADWLIDEGELDRAGVLAAKVATWADRSYDAAWVQLRLYHALGEPNGWRVSLRRAQALAGEREIEPELLVPPEARVATVI